MPATTTYSLTGDPYVDGVLGNLKWAVRDFTFSFPTDGSFYGERYGDGEPTNNFGAFNATQQAATRVAFSMFSAVSDLTFAEITETATRHADLRFAMSDAPSTAWAYFPSTAAEGGDSWFNKSSGYYSNPVKGNYAYSTLLHEIGHALGLEHTHEVNVMPLDRDSKEYSVMSYRSYVGASTSGGYTNEKWGYPQSLMMYDIAGIQHMYGADYTTNSGNTRYSWSPTTGEMSVNGIGQGAPGDNRIFLTVWDGGGVDTYDFSNYTTNLEVDLRPGEWTTTSSTQLAKLHYDGSKVAVGNIANALLHNSDLRSLIENAKGGAGSDAITGNAVANTLWGNAGNDKLLGGDGNDNLLGGAGADRLDGGNGADIANYSRAATGLIADLLSPGINTGEAAGDTYVSIERLYGSRFNDNLRGDNLANLVAGLAGNDTLHGRGGNDALWGGEGNDNLLGGAGADRLDGGNGADIANYGRAASGLTADLLSPGANTGEAAGDTYVSIERLYGTGYDDSLRGDDLGNFVAALAGNDLLYGRDGNDGLWGGAGDDELYGGNGNDNLVGGIGADRLDGGSGADIANYSSAATGLIADLLSPGLNTGDAAGDTYVSIERLYGSRFNDDLRGDDLANLVAGLAGDDTLHGCGGNDTLWGGDGNDRLVGGSGADRLMGGSGADIFIIESVAQSSPAAKDTIGDFLAGTDTIDLRLIDANSNLAGDQAFLYLGSAAFTGEACELNFEDGVVSGDINGDGIADFQINLLDMPVLVESDFYL
jgi:serralysin